MSNSLLLTKSIHPDQTTEKEKPYHSALGNFLPERAAGFNSFCCLMECLYVWGDEWLRHQGRAAGTHISMPGGFCLLRILITPWDKKSVTLSSPLHPQQSPDNCGFIHRTVFKHRHCPVWEREFFQFLMLIFNLWCRSQTNKSICVHPCSGKG